MKGNMFMQAYNYIQEENKWYVVQCKTGRESYAALLLETLGMVIYLPLLKKYKNRTPLYIPFFPGYLFVNADLKRALASSINYCPGVLKVLDFGDGPLALEHEVIEAISQELERLNNRCNGSHNFQFNEILRIKNGPLQGMEVVFVGPTTPSLRVRVLLEFLGGPKETFVDAGMLEKIPTITKESGENIGKKQRLTRGKGRKIK